MMPAPTVSNAEDRLLENRRKLREAADVRILGSWLQDVTTPKSQHSLTGDPSLEEQDEEDELDFSADSDTGGLGSVKHTDSTTALFGRQGLSNNEKLRKQLMGNNANQGRNFTQSGIDSRHTASMARSKRAHTDRGDDDDEHEARTKATASTKPGKRKPHSNDQSGAGVSESVGSLKTDKASTGNVSKKRATSYLDEMLAKRSKKKAKRSDADDD